MRFMMFIMPPGYNDAEPGSTPDADAVVKMMAQPFGGSFPAWGTG